MRKLVIIFYNCLLAATGCAHRGISHNETPITLKSPTVFEISGEKGYHERQKYYYIAHEKTYEGKQIAHEHHEVTEFTVENEIVATSHDPQWIEVKQKTIEKSGPADLNPMAFPEHGETIIFRYGKSGEVFKAGTFPEFSIFYVSPMPLPKTPIQVGDTWKYQTSWIEQNQGLEMSMDLVGTLKGTLSCYQNEICLDVEYSGNIMLPEKIQDALKFRGSVVARFVFRPRNFSVLRSEIRNKESLSRDDNKMEMQSCIVSELVTPQNKTLNCTP